MHMFELFTACYSCYSTILFLNNSKGEEVYAKDDAWSIDEGIHVEDFPGEDLGRPVTDNPVDNSEWTDLVNKTVDFLFD